MKSIIGVMPLWDDERESLWMLPGYLDGIREAGGLPFISPFTEDKGEIRQLASLCGGFLFTGGHDVSPAVYGEKTLEGKTAACPGRDRLEAAVLDICLKEKKPAFGICRGIQFINAYLGGTLFQDLPTEHPSAVDHHMKPPYNRTAHQVDVPAGTPLYDLLGTRRLGVNSYHHQAVRRLAPALQPMAVSEDGIIEGVYAPDHPFLRAVQWHPEFSFRDDPASRKLFRSFVEACGR